MENKTNETKDIKEKGVKTETNFYKDFTFSFKNNIYDLDDWERILDLTSSPFLWTGNINLETDAKPLWQIQREFEVEKSVTGFNFKYADLAEIKKIAKKIDARVAISIVGDKNVEYTIKKPIINNANNLNNEKGEPSIIKKTFVFCVIFEGAPYFGRPLKIEKTFAIEIGTTKTGSIQIDYANGALETYAMRYMYNSFLSIAGSIDPEQLEVAKNNFGNTNNKKYNTPPKVFGKLKDVNPAVFAALEKSPFKNIFINNLKDELSRKGINFNSDTLLEDKKIWEDISTEKFSGIIESIKKTLK